MYNLAAGDSKEKAVVRLSSVTTRSNPVLAGFEVAGICRFFDKTSFPSLPPADFFDTMHLRAYVHA
jgi:hypothetical protein